MRIEFKIENVVASADTGTKLNLQQIATALNNIEYEPSQFPGLIYHVKDPKGAIIFFSNGKLVCTGVKDIETVNKILNGVVQQLRDLGIRVNQPVEINIQSIVASVDLHKLLNLNALAITLGQERVEYDPEHFAGLVYHASVPSVSTLLFDSGKIVCTGAKNEEDLELAFTELIQELEITGLMS
ncbi:MAG: TATA-box-binding protein [Thermoplasmata archaeon]|nr:MAG: TATA-box-binding protein [Thermoplasmata archaeon]